MVISASLCASAQAVELAFVSNRLDNSVSMIRIATQQVAATVLVGTAPVGMAADTVRNNLYVANSGSASITKIDLTTLETVTLSIPGSLPESVAWSRFGDLLLVTSLERVQVGPVSRGRVYVVDILTFTISDSFLVEDDPEGVVIAVDGDQAWFTSDLKIQELELDPNPLLFLTLTDVIDGTLGLDDFEDLAVLPNKSRLFASNQSRNRVDVVDLATETILASIATGTSPEKVIFRPGTNEVHVTNQLSDSVTVFDRDTFSVLGTVALSQIEPRGLAFSSDGSEAYVVMSSSNSVVRYDASARTEIGAPIAVGMGPEEVIILDVNLINSVIEWSSYE